MQRSLRFAPHLTLGRSIQGLGLLVVMLLDGGAGNAAPTGVGAVPAVAAAGAPPAAGSAGALAGTGGAAVSKAEAAAAQPPSSGKVMGPPIPWKDMKTRDRGKYMKKVVTPHMRVLFQEFDAKEFKRFSCATCHGKNPEDRKYKMPSPDLHALPSTPAAFQAKLKTEPTWPKWTKFMFEQVQSQMAALLGQPSFDPKKPEAGGFSCQACHTLTKS